MLVLDTFTLISIYLFFNTPFHRHIRVVWHELYPVICSLLFGFFYIVCITWSIIVLGLLLLLGSISCSLFVVGVAWICHLPLIYLFIYCRLDICWFSCVNREF